jgi:glycosyltransferase involved in cell wall biosynthesis
VSSPKPIHGGADILVCPSNPSELEPHPPAQQLPTLAILPDFPEESWPSMDLVAEMLLQHLPATNLVHATRLSPPYQCRLSFLGRHGKNFDRLRNRLSVYPRFARQHANRYDLFHLCDHSYAQLVHALPPDRTGVLLHDLDTFRCLLDPAAEPRPKWFCAMARKILAGLQKARLVFYISTAVHDQIVRHNLLDPARLIKAPPAAAEEFTAHGDNETRSTELVGSDTYILHVGSCIPRKRIDVLLQTFAAARRPDLKLLQIGGEFTPAQRDLITQLNLADHIVQLRNLPRTTIADFYRRTAAVLQPSDAEGFGLPVVEALACGAPVVASDIPVLHEVGGDAVTFCPVGDVQAWADTISKILDQTLTPPPLGKRLAQAAKFSWAEHARVIAQAYRDLHDARATTEAR